MRSSFCHSATNGQGHHLERARRGTGGERSSPALCRNWLGLPRKSAAEEQGQGKTVARHITDLKLSVYLGARAEVVLSKRRVFVKENALGNIFKIRSARQYMESIVPKGAYNLEQSSAVVVKVWTWFGE